MQALNVLVLVLLSVYQVRTQYHYSSQKCCKCPETEENNNANANIPSGSLSADKQELLDLHNQYRRKVAGGKVPRQPASSKVKDLVCSIQHLALDVEMDLTPCIAFYFNLAME
ncbi:unnamed protein product [Rodentolepis nana]|uniref:SCP domain-containing protein n=1 Tax=Rodentolepis nana TaxID=102285 RepID=A0A0R3TP71_RODNA|nr:unnamed protein product [Rodentolepis nana]